MSLITQQAPFSGAVPANLSINYTNQLLVSGFTGLLLFETTTASAALTVLSDGEVSAADALSPGTYIVSGVVYDSANNSGPWSFTLTVSGPATPQTSVTPFTSPLSTGTEVLVPFQIDPATGAVAVISDYVSVINQHIATIIMTRGEERVMQPTFGAGAESAIFQDLDGPDLSLLIDNIQSQLATWQPEINVLGVTPALVPGSPTTVSITVTYSIASINTVNSVTVTTGGTITQVSGGGA